MSPEEKTELLASYNRRKEANLLSEYLAKPVPSGIKKECIRLYREGLQPENAQILKQFFKKNAPQDFEEALEDIDIDRFRPTAGLLNGRNFTAEEKHYELISWLLGTEEVATSTNNQNDNQLAEATSGGDPSKEEVDNFSWRRTWGRITAAVAALMLLAWVAWLIMPVESQCMYWDGNTYVGTACDVQVPGRTAYALNEAKLDHFKRVLRSDTLTKASVGRLWYFKMNRKLELFTDSGMHPVYTNRRLRPLSDYMLEKYFIKHK
ncbi:hypothetical protein DYU05_06190 [Mucilaginibacter terrenus]|uniref:Uncharacterized protein n=1 Tax=Mucilaginibacter terrenus TaxID=2482727 RepID=A0A3E2NVZ3_9SPHI|nr:hypothetical protein [Mucilaginibacter terrenus]RFZ85188.1 hypothetical protein DYU05_06190 [Mucilaginibacter terrenus]